MIYNITKKDIIQMVNDMGTIIIENEVLFCELDSHAGDGDFGMSIAKGFKQLKSEWNDLNNNSIGDFLKSVCLIISEYCGGASGPIWGAGFLGAAKVTKEKDVLSQDEFVKMLESAIEMIQKRGKAKRGDKTLLDALIPMVEALECNKDKNETPVFLMIGAEAALQGAEETKKMVASRGRASYVGERSLAFPDAGAMALGIIFKEIANLYRYYSHF